MATGKPLKYEPLRRYLAALPAETTRIALPVAQVAAIVGAPLPVRARTRAFWQNAAHWWGASAQARAWQGAGWRVVTFDYRAATVTFARVDATA